MAAMHNQNAIRKFTFDLDLDGEGAVEQSYRVLPPDAQSSTMEEMRIQDTVASAEEQADADAVAEAEAEAQMEDDEDQEPEVPPAPTFSEQDLEAARDEAYVAGHTAALQEAEAATERLMAESLHFIAEHLRQAVGQIDAPYEQLGVMATEIAVAVCRRVMPVVAANHGVEEIETLVRSILPTLIDQPRLVVRVHPALAEQTRGAVRPVVEDVGFEGRIVVMDDPQIQPGDARVEWGDGGIERDTPRTWSEILQVIDRNVVGNSGLNGDLATAEQAADEAFPRLKQEALDKAERAAMDRARARAEEEAEAEVAAREAEGAFDPAPAPNPSSGPEPETPPQAETAAASETSADAPEATETDEAARRADGTDG